jgi:hypothetical protein
MIGGGSDNVKDQEDKDIDDLVSDTKKSMDLSDLLNADKTTNVAAANDVSTNQHSDLPDLIPVTDVVTNVTDSVADATNSV